MRGTRHPRWPAAIAALATALLAAACSTSAPGTATAGVLPLMTSPATAAPSPSSPPTASPTPASTPAPSPAGTPPPVANQPPPRGFAPMSVSFVSPSAGFVLGSYPCSSGPPCLALLRTGDAGRTWTALQPPPSTPSTATGPGQGVSAVRFADANDGWVFAPELWSTHDGGRHWARPALPVAPGTDGVRSLEVGQGAVSALVVGGQPLQVRIFTGLVSADRWTASPTTIPLGAGPVPTPRLVVQGAAGWAVEVDRTVIGGARLAGGAWASWQPPCSSTGGSLSLGAGSASDLAAVCVEGTWTGPSISVHVYLSADGGTSFRRLGALPLQDAAGIAMSSAGTLTVGGIDLGGAPVLLASFDRGSTWQAVYGGMAPREGELGFTTATQGVAVVSADQGSRLLMTRDGGHTWTAVTFG